MNDTVREFSGVFSKHKSIFIFLSILISFEIFIVYIMFNESPALAIGLILFITLSLLIFLYEDLFLYLIFFLIFSGFSELSPLARFHPILALGLIGVLHVLYLWIVKEKKYRLGSTHFALFGFMLMILVSGFEARNASLFYERSYWLLRSIAVYVFAQAIFYNIKRVENAMNTIIVALMLNILYVFYFLLTSPYGFSILNLGGIWRAGGAYFDPNIWATMLLLGFMFSLYMFNKNKEVNRKLFYFFSIGLIGSGIILSFSRSGFLVFSFLIILLILEKWKVKGIAASLIILLTLVTLIYTLPYFVRYKTILNAIIRGEFLDLSMRERINLLKLSLQLFKKHPITGIGIGNFLEYSSALSSRAKLVHSMYLEILCETGILGAIFFVFIILNNAYRLYKLRHKNTIYYYLWYALLGIMLMGLTLSIEFHTFLWAVIGLSEASINSEKMVQMPQ